MQHQTENYTVVWGGSWYSILDKFSNGKALMDIAATQQIWSSPYRSDRIPFPSQTPIDSSLSFIHVSDVETYSRQTATRNQRRAHFSHGDIKYDLALTDPDYDSADYEGEAFLTISLGLPWEKDGNMYKIVASIIEIG